MTENIDKDIPLSEHSQTLRTNYSGNSHKSRENKKTVRDEKKTPEKVTSGKVIARKKPLGKKIKETFIGENMHNVGRFVLYDVLVPAAKSMIVDAMSKGTERAFYGDVRRSSGNNRNRVAYDKMSDRHDRSGGRREPSYRARATQEFNEIVIESRGEAEEVLDQLGDLVENYGVATVNDLNELVGITGDFTDEKWGWTDLRTGRVRRVKDGYLLDLPRTGPID